MALFNPHPINCNGRLQKQDLWNEFCNLETEMIITKSGRRMFPALRIALDSLEPDEYYSVLLEFVPVDGGHRYKYSNASGWAPAGTQDPQSPCRVYLHPESPATGQHWMSQSVSFCRVKLTNTLTAPPGQIVLSSMHKYQPRVVIVKTRDLHTLSVIGWATLPHRCITFRETAFVAVTAYQNDKITKLKIDNNPFAKGFRESGQSKCKRKRNQPESPSTTVSSSSSSRSTASSGGDASLDNEDNVSLTDDAVKTELSISSTTSSDRGSSPAPDIIDVGDDRDYAKTCNVAVGDRHSMMASSVSAVAHPAEQLAATPYGSYYAPNYPHHSLISPFYPAFYGMYAGQAVPLPYPFMYYATPAALSATRVLPAAVQDLSIPPAPVVKKPRNLTDFSIKAITGM